MSEYSSIVCRSCKVLALALIILTANVAGSSESAQPLQRSIAIDGGHLGRTFEGFGALSAGASSRLLIDYPEPQRSDILDYLFKPNFGASLHHLKVEIGGDINSTCGSEPSHARVREELLNPKAEYYQRGYEWWLMREAKKRNPNIILEALQWGAPGWIGEGQVFSQDNADYVVAFLRGAKQHHGLKIDYVGVLNEREYDTAYIKLLRKTLDKAGLTEVGINAGEQWQVDKKWIISEDLRKDPQLRDAVAIVNAHSTEQVSHKTPEYLKTLNIGIWNGEGHAYGGHWYAAMEHARFNRAYPVGKITKVITWSLITSYADYLPVPNSGPMKANTPWSGYYELQPPLWIQAHFNQFAQPGWHYLQTGCAAIREGGSITTLKAPKSDDYSVIIETADAREPIQLSFKLSGGLSSAPLSVWRSSFQQDQFLRLDDIDVVAGQFSITAQPGAIYSLTTTRGQTKGKAPHPIPPNTPYPRQLQFDFEKGTPGSQPQFFQDQHGVFEVAARPDGKGQCLAQVIPRQGIVWRRCQFPHTVLGDANWRNVDFAADFSLPSSGKVRFWVRLSKLDSMGPENNHGAGLEIDDQGNWALKAVAKTLAHGKVAELGRGWHRMRLLAKDGLVEASLDQRSLGTLTDPGLGSGCVGIGTDWNPAAFDNVEVKVLDPETSKSGIQQDSQLSHEAPAEAPL